MVLEQSAGAVVFRRDEDGSLQYLLLQYGASHWDFPRGHIEQGETEEETALREIREETGLDDVALVPGFREEATWFYRRGSATVRKTAVYLLAESPVEEVRLSWEHRDHGWFAIDDARRRATFPATRDIVTAAHRFLTGRVTTQQRLF